MASELAKVYGTEADKIHCPFYYKIGFYFSPFLLEDSVLLGACMYGNYCSRQHVKPTASPTVLIPHMYQNPLSFEGGNQYPPEVIQQVRYFYCKIITLYFISIIPLFLEL